METGPILSILKYVSFIITALSGIWGLLAKTSFEDAQGQKRLTAAGHVSVAIVIASALVGMLAFGFETLAKQDSDRIAADKEARKVEEEARKEAALKADAANERAHLEQLARLQEANRRADEAEQRIFDIATATEERKRQIEIARRVSEGSASNLARTQVALVQLERLLNPIGLPEVTSVWALDSNTPGMGALFTALRELGARLRTNPSLASRVPGIFVSSTDAQGVPRSFDFAQTSPFFPQSNVDPQLYTLFTQAGVGLSVLSDRTDLAGFKARARRQDGRPSLGFFGREGDVGFDLDADTAESTKFSYDIDEDRISIWITDAAKSAYFRQTGAVVSVPDLDRSRLAIFFDDTMVPEIGGRFPYLDAARRHAKPSTIFLRAGGREYIIREFQRLETGTAFPLFLTGPMGKFGKVR